MLSNSFSRSQHSITENNYYFQYFKYFSVYANIGASASLKLQKVCPPWQALHQTISLAPLISESGIEGGFNREKTKTENASLHGSRGDAH